MTPVRPRGWDLRVGLREYDLKAIFFFFCIFCFLNLGLHLFLQKVISKIQKHRNKNTETSLYSRPLVYAAAAAKLLQSCPTLCDPIDGSPPGSPVPGILQARILEWVAYSFSRNGIGVSCIAGRFFTTELPGKPVFSCMLLLLLSCFSCVRLCATSQTAAHQALVSLGFSRQEHWSGLPFPSPMQESEK